MTKQMKKAGSGGRSRFPRDGDAHLRNGGNGHNGGGSGKADPRGLSCLEARPLLRRFLGGQLLADNPALWRAVDDHLNFCQDCYLRLLTLEMVVDSNLLADAMSV